MDFDLDLDFDSDSILILILISAGFGFDLILSWLDFDYILIGFLLIPSEIVEAPSEILGGPRRS